MKFSTFILNILILQGIMQSAVLIEAKGPSAEAINTKLTIVTNFINTASSIHSEENIVLTRLAHLGKLSGALGIIASIFTITVESIGSRRHKQVMAEFEKVNDGIRQVQEDINLLGKQVVLEHKQTRLFDRFNILRQGLKHLANNDTKALRETCLPIVCLNALETVVTHSPDLVQAFYESAEVNGDLEMVATFIDKLVSLVGNSMIMVQGLHSEDITEFVKTKDMEKAFEDSIKLCKEDLPRILPRIKIIAEKVMNSRNSTIAQCAPLRSSLCIGFDESKIEVLTALKSQLDSKFYWLHLGYLVYDIEFGGFENHYLTGYLLPVLNINDLNTVIFFRPKSDIVVERVSYSPHSYNEIFSCLSGCNSCGSDPAYDCFPGDVEKFYATATIKGYCNDTIIKSIPLELRAVFYNNFIGEIPIEDEDGYKLSGTSEDHYCTLGSYFYYMLPQKAAPFDRWNNKTQFGKGFVSKGSIAFIGWYLLFSSSCIILILC